MWSCTIFLSNENGTSPYNIQLTVLTRIGLFEITSGVSVLQIFSRNTGVVGNGVIYAEPECFHCHDLQTRSWLNIITVHVLAIEVNK